MQDHSIRVHKQTIKESVVMFLRSLNNLHVLSNVGFYIDGISQESYLFIGVSQTQKRMMTDRLNTMNLPTKLKVGKGTYKSIIGKFVTMIQMIVAISIDYMNLLEMKSSV